jgi:hypothetical protein
MSRLTPTLLTVPKPCNKCGYCIVRLGDNGRLRCERCKDDRGALDVETLTFIRTIEKNFGPLTEPIVLRGKNSTQARSDQHLINLASIKPSDSTETDASNQQTESQTNE